MQRVADLPQPEPWLLVQQLAEPPRPEPWLLVQQLAELPQLEPQPCGQQQAELLWLTDEVLCAGSAAKHAHELCAQAEAEKNET